MFLFIGYSIKKNNKQQTDVTVKHSKESNNKKNLKERLSVILVYMQHEIQVWTAHR